MKKLLSTGALLLCCTAAHADVAYADPSDTISWGFSFNGFYDSVSNSFLPEEVISGSFKGHDLDSNGLLEKDELLSLVVGELDYIACAAGSNAFYQCGATSFSFSQDAGLHFSVGSYGQDPEGWVGGGRLMNDGTPVSYKLSISFKELKAMTREDYNTLLNESGTFTSFGGIATTGTR